MITLRELEKLELKIIELRDRMHELINRKPELKDPEIVFISQELDKLLNLYEEIKKQL